MPEEQNVREPEEKRSVLLVTNALPGEPGGRSEKIGTRKRLLTKLGWETHFGHVPDPSIDALLPAAIGIAKKAREEDVDVVQSISNPPELQSVGYLVSLLSRRPWLAEFRDPLVTNPAVEDGSTAQTLRKFIERFIISQADHIVWGDGIQVPEGYFAKTYGESVAEKVMKLPFAGFDGEKFTGITPAEYDGFTLTYAGSFYEGWLEPYRFLEGVREYTENFSNDFTVQFYGDWTEDYEEHVTELGIQSTVEVHDFVPHEEILPVLKGSDAVVYIGGSDPRNRRNVPSKIMDYIGVSRPILAVASPEFRVSELVQEHALGIAVSPNDSEGIAEAIHTIRTQSDQFEFGDELRAQFSRRQKMRELDEVLRSLITTE
jgi:glycosyltransferase involved in cell wall biosynthesis